MFKNIKIRSTNQLTKCVSSMFRSIAFDMSEDTEESFEIPEDDEYRNKSEEEEIQNVEQSPTRNSLSKEFLDRKSKMKVLKNKSGI